MRVFVAGSTGVVGRLLVPQLIENRHEIVALVRDAEKAKALDAMGAKVAIAVVLDKEALTAAIRRAEPEVIIHQLTAAGIATDGPMVDLVRTRRMPIVGDGGGIWSFVHI